MTEQELREKAVSYFLWGDEAELLTWEETLSPEEAAIVTDVGETIELLFGPFFRELMQEVEAA